MIIGNWGEGFYFEMGIKYRIANRLLTISFYWLILSKYSNVWSFIHYFYQYKLKVSTL